MVVIVAAENSPAIRRDRRRLHEIVARESSVFDHPELPAPDVLCLGLGFLQLGLGPCDLGCGPLPPAAKRIPRRDARSLGFRAVHGGSPPT